MLKNCTFTKMVVNLLEIYKYAQIHTNVSKKKEKKCGMCRMSWTLLFLFLFFFFWNEICTFLSVDLSLSQYFQHLYFVLEVQFSSFFVLFIFAPTHFDNEPTENKNNNFFFFFFFDFTQLKYMLCCIDSSITFENEEKKNLTQQEQ